MFRRLFSKQILDKALKEELNHYYKKNTKEVHIKLAVTGGVMGFIYGVIKTKEPSDVFPNGIGSGIVGAGLLGLYPITIVVSPFVLLGHLKRKRLLNRRFTCCEGHHRWHCPEEHRIKKWPYTCCGGNHTYKCESH